MVTPLSFLSPLEFTPLIITNMETKLSYLCVCPWARLADFLAYVKDYVPSQIFPSRDGKSALVEFTPSVNEVVALIETVGFYSEKYFTDGKENI